VYVRFFVKEPPVWLENRRQQRLQRREVRAPFFKIFQRGMIANTLNACWWVITERNEGLIWALTAFDLQLSADSSDPLIPTDRRIARFSDFRFLPSARKYLLPSAE
ncbi:MAG: hypothetical protein JO001_10360, partial [Alphaproteobacteria bacterium]|nr:hypothetical protein [Alphaproteobacteria bacterium]